MNDVAVFVALLSFIVGFMAGTDREKEKQRRKSETSQTNP